jgi:hypothetical protein
LNINQIQKEVIKMEKFNVRANDKFTVLNAGDWRFGRTYKVIGFMADKFGKVFAVCEWLQEKGFKSSHIFYAEDFA